MIDGGDWFECMWLVWPTDQIIRENLLVRSEGAEGTYDSDLHDLLFFAGAGSDGILFAHPIAEDRIAALEVVVWHPIDDELTEIAPSLEEFVQGWLTGAISV